MKTTRSILLTWFLLQSAPVGADLADLIVTRLALMKDVASYKWHHKLPVEDTTREKTVIEAAVSAGLNHGIRVEVSRSFYRAQIEAAKEIQRCWLDRWQRTAPPVRGADLITDIRPQLLKLGHRIADTLADGSTVLSEPLSIDCLSADSKQAISESLQGIRIYADRFEQVNQSRTLRVGTTGDYAPFTFSTDGTHFTGIDIDLAHNLAESLGAEAVFVQTSWPTLMTDLENGRYDIGMGGVSITEVRLQSAFFSTPYHIGGKTPITKCGRTTEFDSLEKIDRTGVRLIVNPGGTNEMFLDSKIRHASKILFNDNRDIFNEILTGRADLMVTDRIEVRLQTAKHKTLCAAMPGKTLTYQEKGYMMPQDRRLRDAVNTWLVSRREDGTLAGTFDRHLLSPAIAAP